MDTNPPECFDEIKALACKVAILKPIQWDIPKGLTDSKFKMYSVWVITDAFPAGMGAILAQGENWQTATPAAFMSKKFTSTQCSYYTYELDVRNPILSHSDEPPTSIGGVGSIQSRLTRVRMRLMMRIGEYV